MTGRLLAIALGTLLCVACSGGGSDPQGGAHVLPMDPNNPRNGLTLSGFYVDTDTWNAAGYQPPHPAELMFELFDSTCNFTPCPV